MVASIFMFLQSPGESLGFSNISHRIIAWVFECVNVRCQGYLLN